MKISTQATVQSCSRFERPCWRSATKIPTKTARTRIVGSLSNSGAIPLGCGAYHGNARLKTEECQPSDQRNEVVIPQTEPALTAKSRTSILKCKKHARAEINVF